MEETIRYRSHFEKCISNQLREAKVRYRYEAEPIRYESFGHPRTYWPDFAINTGTTRKGDCSGATQKSKVFIECKGWLRTDDRWKLERVREANPEIDLRICFWDATKPIETGTPEMDYGAGLDRWPTLGEWAEGLGFMWCHRELPKAWLDEWSNTITTTKETSENS
jgi:hypothetical protein